MAQGLGATDLRNPRHAQRATPVGRSDTRPTNDPVGPLPIEEIYPIYPNEWVVVKVTALDEQQRISHGEVLAHSISRKTVSRALLRAHREDPGVRTYLFPGGPRAATVEEWREHLAEAAREPLNARW